LQPFYTIHLSGSTFGVPIAISPDMDVSLYDNHTWFAVITNGNVVNNSGNGFTTSVNSTDIIKLDSFVMPVSSPWTANVVNPTSVIDGYNLTGSAGGPAIGTGPANFSGTANGIW